jgi:hypothetical protein
MQVTFRRIGARRYDVLVDRDNAPQMIMHPAPGFDAFLPHDLLHFVAESEWGIDDAVFGQLAAGGDAGTFWPTQQGAANKWKHRGERLRKSGRGMKRSERIAGALEAAWRRGPLPSDWDERLEAAGIEDRRKLDRVVASLDEVAARWHSLHVGESLTLPWPRPERRRRSAA